jgi:hypothetical protein
METRLMQEDDFKSIEASNTTLPFGTEDAEMNSDEKRKFYEMQILNAPKKRDEDDEDDFDDEDEDDFYNEEDEDEENPFEKEPEEDDLEEDYPMADPEEDLFDDEEEAPYN